MSEKQLLAFNFTKINVEKNPSFAGDLEINSNIDIKNIEKTEMSLVKQDLLKIDFDFKIDYKDLGNILIQGFLILMLDAKSTKDLLSEWKEKKIPEETKVLILNLVMQKCSLKALELEEDIGLPYHVQLPHFEKKKE